MRARYIHIREKEKTISGTKQTLVHGSPYLRHIEHSSVDYMLSPAKKERNVL